MEDVITELLIQEDLYFFWGVFITISLKQYKKLGFCLVV